MIVVLALAALLAVIVVAVPLSLLQRYRAGTKRRAAREWVSTINLLGLVLSAGLLLAGSAITNLWVPRAFLYVVGGLLGGGVLGLVGLALTRWEVTHRSIHYTPSRLLVGAVLLIVTARVIFGFWRSWHLWQTDQGEFAWVAATGAAASLGAGAIVVGYYLMYFAGVRIRAARHRSLHSR
jgi:hypothetical protein